MGWLFKSGNTRRDIIEENTKGWERTNEDGTRIKSVCLAHCYRGGVFSGVLWSVWERTFVKDDQQVEPTQRWIVCDLLRYQKDYGWGYKDMEESMHPYFYSCPLKYLDLVPIEQFGGHAEWRELVRSYHARITEKRRARKAARSR
jgi:hypothetical protein